MSSQRSPEQEIREILIAANGGEATQPQLVRLDELIRTSPPLAKYAALVLDQQAALAWQGVLLDRPSNVGGAVALAGAGAVTAVASAPTGSRGEWMPATAVPSASMAPSMAAPMVAPMAGRGLTWPALAAGMAFVAGATLALAAGRGIPWRAAQQTPSEVSKPALPPSYEAQLVRSTACLWSGSSPGSRPIGSGLASGESLHLLEGLADFHLDWSIGGSATLSLEGPAAMILTTEGMPSLRFGRLTATISASHRPFAMETPVGRLMLADYGSLGVSAYGNDAEIHVFDGMAVLEPAWSPSPGRVAPIPISAGESIRVRAKASGELSIERHKADVDYFIAQVSMTSDALLVPAAYVAAIKQAAPLAYWRFERDIWPAIPNEMGDQFAGRIEGSIGTVGHPGNQAVEFGVTDRSGEIHTTDSFGELVNDQYTIEFWLKPSHFHVGAVISLVGSTETPAGIIPHGLLLELGGSGQIPTAVHHPGRIRFLHRSPASNDPSLGTSCYSTDAYTLRRWQHVAAVKDTNALRLFIDGELVGEGVDDTPLPPELRLVIGRLYPSRKVRPFIGQFDELALYNRALSQDELREHFNLMSSAPADSSGI